MFIVAGLIAALIAFLSAPTEAEQIRMWPALEKLLHAFLRPRIARKGNLQSSAIADLVQDFMCELLTIARDYDFSSLSHDQFGTTQNELSFRQIVRAFDRALDRMSRSMHRQFVNVGDQCPSIPARDLSAPELALETLKEFELSEQECKLLIGLFCEGHSIAEMARQLDLPVASIRQLRARLINRLRGH